MQNLLKTGHYFAINWVWPAQLNCGAECCRWGYRYNNAYSAVIHEMDDTPGDESQ